MQDAVRRSYRGKYYALELGSSEYVKVVTSATQAIASKVTTKLLFGTVVHGSGWSADRYNVPSDGIYNIKATIVTTGTPRGLKLMLYKNGVLYQSLSDAVTVSFPVSQGSTDIALVSTDYLELWFYASGTSSVANSPDCQVCIRRVA